MKPVKLFLLCFAVFSTSVFLLSFKVSGGPDSDSGVLLIDRPPEGALEVTLTRNRCSFDCLTFGISDFSRIDTLERALREKVMKAPWSNEEKRISGLSLLIRHEGVVDWATCSILFEACVRNGINKLYLETGKGKTRRITLPGDITPVDRKVLNSASLSLNQEKPDVVTIDATGVDSDFSGLKEACKDSKLNQRAAVRLEIGVKGKAVKGLIRNLKMADCQFVLIVPEQDPMLLTPVETMQNDAEVESERALRKRWKGDMTEMKKTLNDPEKRKKLADELSKGKKENPADK